MHYTAYVRACVLTKSKYDGTICIKLQYLTSNCYNIYYNVYYIDMLSKRRLNSFLEGDNESRNGERNRNSSYRRLLTLHQKSLTKQEIFNEPGGK